MHEGGILDIPFPRAVRNGVLAAGLAEQHHWVPNSGWITFRVRNAGDLSNAMWLMRLSYIRLRSENGNRSSRDAGAGKCGNEVEPGAQVPA